MDPCVASIFDAAIDPLIVECQRKVVDRFNITRRPFYQVRMTIPRLRRIYQKKKQHSDFLDEFLNSTSHDVVLFLDVDCVPVSEKAIDYYLTEACQGKLIGNAQRANHIQNNEHLYASPAALGISIETYNKLGRPSASPSDRGDVAEELTYIAELKGIPIELVMPSRYDRTPSWPLRSGLHDFGIGTTYTHPTLGDLFWHCFQITVGDRGDFFKEKCLSFISR
jgi:hypothetical protein